MRIMPVLGHTGRIATIFRSVLDGKTAPSEAASELESISSGGLISQWGVGEQRGQDVPAIHKAEASS